MGEWILSYGRPTCQGRRELLPVVLDTHLHRHSRNISVMENNIDTLWLGVPANTHWSIVCMASTLQQHQGAGEKKPADIQCRRHF